MGVRRSCGLMGMALSSYYYQANPRCDEPLRAALKEKAEHHHRWGYRLLTDKLREDGWTDNPKRIFRVYQELGLQLAKRKKRKTSKWRGKALEKPSTLNEVWAMDFMSDQLANGRKLRLLNVMDLYSRECLAVEVDTSMGGERVSRVLDSIIERRGKPKRILTDNGPEFTSRAMDQWAYRLGIKHEFIQPGKPTQNGMMERLNGTCREECLNQHWFRTLAEARELASAWRYEYNWVRCHGSLGRVPPGIYAQRQTAELPTAPEPAPTSNEDPFSRATGAMDNSSEVISREKFASKLFQ